LYAPWRALDAHSLSGRCEIERGGSKIITPRSMRTRGKGRENFSSPAFYKAILPSSHREGGKEGDRQPLHTVHEKRREKKLFIATPLLTFQDNLKGNKGKKGSLAPPTWEGGEGRRSARSGAKPRRLMF